MSAYVDPLLAWPARFGSKWRHGPSCHLYADTLDELNALAETIGLRREWLQTRRGTTIPARFHYDLNAGKRRLALRAGAREITHREAFKLRHGMTVEEMARMKKVPEMPKNGPTAEVVREQRLKAHQAMEEA